VTKGCSSAIIYGGRNEPELKITDVFTCQLRKEL